MGETMALKVTIGNKSKCVSAWARECGVSRQRLWAEANYYGKDYKDAILNHLMRRKGFENGK